MAQKTSSNALLVFGADAGARILGFLAAAHLARTLGRDGFGVIVVGLSFLSYVLWFADLGLGTLGTREMGRPEGARTYAPREVLWARIALGGLVLAPAFLLALLLFPDQDVRWIAAGYLLTTVPYVLTLEWYYQGIGSYAPLVISRTLTAALYLVLLYLFVADPTAIARVPLAWAVANLIPAVLLFFFKRPEDSFSPRALAPSRTAAIVRHAGTIGFGGIFAQTVQLLPPLVLGYYSTSSAGLLGAALRIVAVVLILDRVFSALFLPAISRLMASDRPRAIATMERVLALVVAAAFACAVPLTVCAGGIMLAVFGPEYSSGAVALAITAWFAAVTLINSVFCYGLIAAGHERAYLRATVLGGIVTACLTVGLVHVAGLSGAAIAMTISELCIVTLTWWQFRRVAPLRAARPLITASAVAAAIVGVGLWLDLGASLGAVLWQAPLLALVFTGALMALGGLRRADIVWAMEK